MKYSLGAGALSALALLAPPAMSAGQAGPGPVAQSITVQGQKNPSPWFKAESQHFIVYSDTSQQGVSLLLDNLERLDFLLRTYARPYLKPQPHAPKLTLYYHGKVAALKGHGGKAPPDALGMYRSCSTGVQAAGVLLEPVPLPDNARLSTAPANDTLSSLFEGYARHFLYRHTDIRAPLSFIEGFAQYFAGVRFSSDQLVVGKSPPGAAAYLNFIEDGHRYSLDYDDVLAGNDSDGRHDAGVAAIRLEFRARSWLLTHFMLSNDDNRNRLARYLDLANRGTPAAKALETAYGIAPGQLGPMLWRYRRSNAKVLQVEVPDLPTAQVVFTSLPDTVTPYVMLDAALKTCPDRDTGAALLARAGASGPPNHPLARLALSRAQIGWGNPEDAIPALRQLAGDGHGNAEAVYLLGLAHLGAARRQQGEARAASLEAARRHLVDAVNADPASAAASHALLRTELDSGEPLTETAVVAAQLAWDQGREVSVYVRAAALVHAYAGNSAKSRQALAVLARNRQEPAVAAWAADWQARLQAGVDRDDLLAELRRLAVQETPFDEWTIDSGSVMQAVVRAAGVERARHYLQGLPVDVSKPEQMIFNTPFTR